MAVGAAVKLLVSLAFLFPGEVRAALPVLPKAELALEVAPALLGVGFILGYRRSAVCVAGAIVSALALTPLIAWLGSACRAPLYPETHEARRRHGPRRHLVALRALHRRRRRRHGRDRHGAARTADDGRRVPRRRARAARATRQPRASRRRRTDRDLPAGFVFGGIVAVVAVAGLVPGVFAGEMAPLQRAVCAAGVGVFGVLFVAVAARIVGIVGVSSQPTSGITLVTLLGVGLASSRPRAGPTRARARRCSRWARSSRSRPRRPATSRRT